MDSYNEREYCEKIERLVSNGNFKDAETLIHKITDLINKQPSYPGYYWRARAYYFLDKNKYALNILKDIENSSRFIEDLPNKEMPIPALILRAKACGLIKDYDSGIETCNEIIKRKAEGEAYYLRVGLTAFKFNDDDMGLDDIKKAAQLGFPKAVELLKKAK